MTPLTRRAFLGTALAAPLAAGLYAWRLEPHWLEITRLELAIANLPAALEGKTLAHFTDLHAGPQVDNAYLIETFQHVRALQPDLVVHTGDLVTAQDRTYLNHARAILAHFPLGPLGTFAVLGNHDYGESWANPETAAAVIRVLSEAGIRVLRNETTDVLGLRVTGLDDLWSRRCDPAHAFADLAPDRPALTLCHNPDACDAPGWERFRGWVLAGHTHGGQCKPPFLPPPLLPVRNRRYTAGLIELSGGRRLYISRGVGHLQRVRFNARPEVALFTLRRAP